MIQGMFSIDNLIAVVQEGGSVKTGVDVYDRGGTLLLAKDVVVNQVRTLEIIKRNGLRSVPVAKGGGLFDGNGNQIRQEENGVLALAPKEDDARATARLESIEKRLKEIVEIRQEADLKYSRAKASLKLALDQVRETQGEFDVQAVESQVSDMVAFSLEAGHPISYMGRDLFSFDQYLYDHAVHVCAMGTAVAHRFNASFSSAVESALWSEPGRGGSGPGSFAYYYPDDMKEISFGLFVYDIGKALVPEPLLNKESGLNPDEFKVIQRHSYEFGSRILDKNRLDHPIITNLVQYHHAPLFEGEGKSYPLDKPAADIPLYVKICKLVDSYDAMISKRSYKDAQNQVLAATELFRTYVKKDPMLQFILHAFVNSIGLYPPGSIVYLKNGQMAYVLENRGPIVLPFTDTRGRPLSTRPDPFDTRTKNELFQVDTDRSIQKPREVFNLLPDYIRSIALPRS